MQKYFCNIHWNFILKVMLFAGIEAYHVVYISIWALFVAYIVVEIWLYCVLIIGITSVSYKRAFTNASLPVQK